MTELKDIDAEVIALLENHVGEGVDVTPTTRIVGDTKMDSVAVMDFVMELEDHLDITIPLNRLADVTTVEDLLVAVRPLAGERQ